ncbi:MAG: hypothetical protein H6667_04265 [Ardenticatenaceae bacterium]|nr:hypothetical protein [Ardenticatenaceae bacterium]
MSQKSGLYRFTTALVAISLLLQLFVPFISMPGATAVQAALPAQSNPSPTLSTNQTQPDPLSRPLTLSRAQTTYQADSQVVVTYSLRNNLGPTVRPEVAPGATITDTIDAIKTTDFAADANTIRNAQIALQITNGQTSLLASSLPVDASGSSLAFNLGDIPPLGTTDLVLTMTIPSSAADFVDLDAGAAAYGSWRARPVTATVSPIRLAPDGFAQWLVCTPDANCDDPYITRQAAELGHDATAIFEFVHGLGYESYLGSLRGARGTLWSAAGNGYDQASLLIALLRASGIPAAYRQGALSQTDAQTLIASMFSEVNAPSGLVPVGVETAVPINDLALITEAQDHAWVEAYLPGSGWTSLDPSFAAAQPGDTFATASSGQLAELPDSIRHHVTASLEVEKYQAFPVGGTNLYTISPLTATFTTVELVGEPLVFAHLVESNIAGGMAFTTAQHTYTPYFVAGTSETLIEGEAFGELLSNFPFGQDFVVAEWLDFTITDPTGNSSQYRRELFDDIGYDVRTGGGLVGELARDETARVSLMSSWTTLVASYAVPEDVINDAYQEMTRLSLEGIETRDATADLVDTPNPTPEQDALAQEAAVTYGQLARLSQRLHLLKFAASSDQSHEYLSDIMLVKAYPDSPRLFTVGWERNELEQIDKVSFDLLHNRVRTIAYPGQTDIGLDSFLFWRGLLDMAIEYEILQEAAPEPLTSVGAVLDAAIANDIPIERITYGQLDDLADMPISSQAKARITTALMENTDQYILVPAEMITLPGAAEPTIGWLAIDNETSEVIDTMENGQHMVAVEYAALAKFSQKAGSFIGGFTAGFFNYTMGFWIGFFSQMPLDGQDIGQVIANSKSSAASWGKQAEKACVKKSDAKWCKRGVAAGNALGSALVNQSDPPLQEALFVLPLDEPVTTAETAVSLTQPATLNGNVTANVTTSQVGVYGTAVHNWTTAGRNSFFFDFLSAGSASVYQNGSLVGSGAVTAVPITTNSPAIAQVQTSGVTVNGTANGSLTLHAPALANLGGGSQWDSYNVALNGSSYTLALDDAAVTVNGTTYSGNFEIVTSTAVNLSGSGATAVPNFAANVNITPGSGGFSVANASGSLTIDGNPVSAANGFALGGVANQATITPSGAVDRFNFNGNADFFTLNLSSNTTSTPADTAASFNAAVAANFNDTYTLSIIAPDGWDATANSSGLITAQPPIDATLGEHAIVVTAQSQKHPDLFVSAVHLVTVTAVNGVTVSIASDPFFTIPWGPNYGVVNFDSELGRLQIPDAAFAATIQNRSSIARTFNVNVSGLPAGWTILGGKTGSNMQIDLAASETVRLGLYISPTVSLPPVGSSYPFNVTATAIDNSSVTATGSEAFTMPAVAYPALAINSPDIYVEANSSADFDLVVTNIGNTTGSFDLSSSVPVADWQVSNLPPSVTLNPGESATQTVSVAVTGGDQGVDYPVAVGAAAPTLPYEPITAVNFYLVSAFTRPIFAAAVSCTLDSDALAASLEALAVAVADLEESCDAGTCTATQRDVVVEAANTAAHYAHIASRFVTEYTAVEAIAADLATHTSNVDIEADLAALGTAVTDLSAEMCVIEEHAPSARFTPYVDAALLGENAAFSLDVTNDGTLATTYAITVTGLPGGDLFFNETIQPGAAISLPITPAATTQGAYDITATITPVGVGIIEATAVARFNVVDKFVQVTQVVATPDFVETGISSTDLSVEIANVSGIAQVGNARTAVLAPDGSTAWTQDIPLTALAGNPHFYDLATVDTSGWAEGTYTVTVDFLDGTGALIPNGSGYGYFNVGQALVASQMVYPEIVAPGNMTVTTIITTEIKSGTIGDGTPLSLTPDQVAPTEIQPWQEVSFLESLTSENATSSLLDGPNLAKLYAAQVVETAVTPADSPISYPLSPVNEPVETAVELDTVTAAGEPPIIDAPMLTIGGFTRTEQDDTAVLYTGTWSNITNARASGGNYYRNNVAGSTTQFNFSGTWLNIGFLGSILGGQAEIAIDSVSQGVFDLYRREDTAVSFVFDGLSSGSHSLTITVLSTANPSSSNKFVSLDYIDAWDGSALPDGTFEQDDARVIANPGWSTISDANASGGSYMRSNSNTVWFPFSGDSFSFHSMNRSFNGRTLLYVDGQYLTNLQTFNFDTITRTYSFDGFGPGPHILQVSAYRSDTAVDAFSTPGTAPFDDPNPISSYMRYEEDHPDWLYNGLPFPQTAQSWSRLGFGPAYISSDAQVNLSSTAGDTAVLTVNGQWINIGFAASSAGGSADIYLDGAYQQTIDLYRRYDSVTSAFLPGLSSGTHTISVTAVGDGSVWIDFVDVWDGTTLPDGTFDAFPGDFYLSNNWGRINSANAENGSYLRTNNGTAWFPFTGDSVSYKAFANSSADEARLYLDDQFIGTLDLFNSSDITRTFAFEGLGSRAHLLRLEQHRGYITIEDFTTPGAAPFYDPPVPSGIIRYEEDDPALLYNGQPFDLTTTTWNYNINLAYHGSEGYYAYSSTPGDEVSLTFDGTWFGIGFLTWRTRGIADIYLDGSLLDSVDLYTLSDDTRSVYYTTPPGTHTVSVVVSGSSHVNAVGTEIAVDYIDVWDGTAVPDGTFEETDRDRLIYSPDWSYRSDAAASGGGYAQDGNANNGSVWFPFTGDSVSLLALAKHNSHEIRIKIDGVPMSSDGVFDIYNEQPISRTFSFEGLGGGPHMMEVRGYRYDTAVDAFITPATTAGYQEPPAPTGIVRYEEDDPALRYNGYPFQQTEYCSTCWFMTFDGSSSNAYIAESRHVGDWVEMDFYGSWAGVGFATGSSGGVAEVFIDGTSVATVTLTSPQDVKSIYFGNLITATHTISISNLTGRLYFDFFDVWDGTPMADGWFDANLDDHRGPYYYSALSSWYTQYPEYLRPRIQYAREDDVLSRSAISYNTHLWFTFTGNDLLFLPFQKAGETVELFIDGVSQDVLDLTAEYSDQPLAVYYNDLGSGPHVVHVNAANGPYIDAFMPNPPNFLSYTPVVEWTDMAPSDVYTTTYTNSGLLTTVGIGDLEGDGIVEIVVPASNGQLYVYRGDGQDTGDGDPILWQSDLVGVAAEPTLVDLDGDGQSEIIVMGSEGTAAFHADGSVYWFTDTIKSTIENAGWGGSSVGNLDLEPGPEIVLAAHNDALYVLDHDGTILASEPTGALPAVPTLADVTGDGILDIIFAQDKTITAYDYFNSFNVAWTYTHTYPGFYGQAFGSPAVVDVDGKQPGGDDGPEIVINWGHYIDVLDADGSFLWNYYTGDDNHRRPSPITVADLDGDNEIEILTASARQSGFLITEHTLLALNADGTLLWSQSMGDTSASASGVATQDLDGDGVWEVIWNGLHEGFTIMDGPTGTKLFNEAFTESGTFVDYPALGDVDGDGYAEVVTGGYNGVFVIGHDGIWGDSRPLWNQHNYHVTNINDDWSVPINEPNNWDIHNTYRTQTPDRNPTPAYQIALTYTAGINNVTVLTDTASVPLTAVPPTYTWAYHQEWYQPIITTTFDSLLTDMQPGEVRQVSQGTQIGYRLPSGMNYLTLPPTYVSAPRIVTMSPAEIMAAAGTTAVYDITLFNPDTTSGDTYTLALAGIPDAWASYPASVPLAAGEEVTVTLTVNIPADAAADTLPVIVDVTNGAGGTDQAMTSLTIIAGLEMTIEPDVQTAVPGETVTYTLTITNHESIAHTYNLTATGLTNVSLPPSVIVPGGDVVTVIITVSADNQGPQPFTITATGNNGTQISHDAVLDVTFVPDIGLTLAPDPAVTGPGSTAVLTATVTNLGDLTETFDLSVTVPAGWSYELQRNGTTVTQLNLPPHLFNSADLLLLVTPDVAAVAGDYAVSVTAVPQSNPAIAKTITNTVQISNRGVRVEILSGPVTLDPRDIGTWNVRVTNTGSVADTFDLQAAGLLAQGGTFSTNAVTLNPGQSQIVPFTADNLNTLLPQTVTFVAAATSQGDGRIQHQDSRTVTFTAYEAVESAWQPATQIITGTLTANFSLVLTNTGNVATTYQIAVDSVDASASTAFPQVTVPARSSMVVVVTVTTPDVGIYQVDAVVSSLSSGALSNDTAVLTVNAAVDPYPIKVMLPAVMK